MNRFVDVLLIVVCLNISTSINAAQITNLTVTSGEFSGDPAFGGAFPFITNSPAAFTSFGGYNLVTDFPTPVGWDPAVPQSSPDASAVTGFIANGATNFFMAENHFLDLSGLNYSPPTGTVNGSQAGISDGDVIEFDMDGLFLNWNGNVFNVGGVATGVVTNVSGNTFDYTMSWSGIVNAAPFPGQVYNLIFSGSGNVNSILISTNIINLEVTGGEFGGDPAVGGAFPFITNAAAAFTSFGGYNLVTDFPTPVGWDPAVPQSSPDPSAVTGFIANGATNFFMAENHFLDSSGLNYSPPSGTVSGTQPGVSNGDIIEFDMDGLFLNWNGNVFNVGGVATGVVTNVVGDTFDYTMSWSGIVNAAPFPGQPYNLIFTGSGVAAISPDGDLNLDGNVNTADLVLAVRASLGNYSLTSLQLSHGDVAPLVNGFPSPDGVFDTGDMLVISRKVIGQINF